MGRLTPVLAILLPVLAFGAAPDARPDESPAVIVLGIAQDGGAPHAGCRRDCCRRRLDDPGARLHVSCLGVVDPATGERWLIDATPDFPAQLAMLDEVLPASAGHGLDGVLLTHAHIGHYTGLMHLGREVMGARGVPVYAMPRMRAFLERNGPWDQLVELGNVRLEPLDAGSPVTLNERLSVTPLLVPHRDEYSETVGFRIQGPARSVLFIPDIDKWDRWDRSIADEVAAVDVAYLDGTFFGAGELPGRDMSRIPHPLISDTLERFAAAPPEVRGRVRFIHLNHTNPALDAGSPQRRAIEEAGMAVAAEGERVEM